MRRHGAPNRSPEGRKWPKRTAKAAVALGFAAVALSSIGTEQNQTFAEPPGSCESPFKASNQYVDSATNTYVAYSGIFTTGLVIKTHIEETDPAKKPYGIEVAFKNPLEPNAQWNVSNMIVPNAKGDITTKVAIADGDTEFGIREVAPAGSPACKEAPTVAFNHVGMLDYFTSSGNLPWPNFVNKIFDVL